MSVKRNGFLILSEYGNIGGFFTNESEAEKYFKNNYSDEKGYYIFECNARFTSYEKDGDFFI